MARTRKSKIANFFKQNVLLTGLLALLVVGAVIVLYNSHRKQTAVTIPSNKTAVVQPETVKSSPQATSTTPNDTTSPKSTTSGGGSSSSQGTLSAPSGSFVSNHRPSSSTQEESFCNTSAGATCYIQFTKGGAIKKLEAQSTGGSGSVYWTWNVGDAGLSAGSWQVMAVATLNGQTKTTNDQIPLEVQP
jgi:hypothetical protein